MNPVLRVDFKKVGVVGTAKGRSLNGSLCCSLEKKIERALEGRSMDVLRSRKKGIPRPRAQYKYGRILPFILHTPQYNPISKLSMRAKTDFSMPFVCSKLQVEQKIWCICIDNRRPYNSIASPQPPPASSTPTPILPHQTTNPRLVSPHPTLQMA